MTLRILLVTSLFAVGALADENADRARLAGAWQAIRDAPTICWRHYSSILTAKFAISSSSQTRKCQRPLRASYAACGGLDEVVRE